jgi:HEAT repeat protein
MQPETAKRFDVATIFKIRPGEELPTGLLLLHSFFVGVSLVFFETTSYALFLESFGVDKLPYVYIVSSLFITVFGVVYSRFEERFPFTRLLSYTLTFLLFSVLLLWGLLTFTASPWLPMGLVIWHSLMAALIGLEFWGLAGHLFNVRQGKRLFGLIGIGEILAGIVSGFSVPTLVHLMGQTQHLLLISAGGIAACLLILAYILRLFGDQLNPPDEEQKEGKPAASLPRNRYLALVLSFATFSVLAYYCLDYVFYEQVDAYYQTEAEIASFLGFFLGAMGIINFFTNAFVPGRVITRYGLSLGLLTVPCIVLVGMTGAASVHGAAAVFFWLAAATKLLDEVMRNAIGEPSLRILYQPFPPGQRLRAQTLLETIAEPAAGALTGLLLLAATEILAFQPVHIVLAALLTCVGWIVVGVLLRREYTVVLMKALTRRKLGGGSLSLDDEESEAVLRKGLESSEPGVVIYCLDMLEEIEHERLNVYLLRLLEHAEPQVRLDALERIGRLAPPRALTALQDRLRHEKVPAVRGGVLRTLCAVAETEAFEQVFPFLESSDIEERRGAMVGLLSYGGIDGVLNAGANLNALLASGDPSDRGLAAQVLGEVGIASFYRPLLRLLADPDLSVRQTAIQASGHLKNPKLLPSLLDSFSVPSLKKTAISAIVAFGEGIVPELEDAFDAEGQTRELRGRIIRILGRIGGERAIDVLKRKIDFSEEDIRNRILSALVQCRYRASWGEVLAMKNRIRNEVKDATWTLSAIVDFGDYGPAAELVKALESEVEGNRCAILLMLAMIYPRDSILSAQAGIASSSKDKRARAVEMLDSLVSQEIKDLVIPLLEDISTARRQSRLVAYFEQRRMSPHERLKEILSRSQQWTSVWTKSCALFTVGKVGTMEFYDSVISSLAEAEPVVRETAVWALGCLNPNDLVERLQPLTSDKVARVAQFSRFVINSVGFASIPSGKGYLTRSGRYTVDIFASILSDEGERRVRRCRAANILSRFKSNAARSALLEGLTISDKTIRTAVLDALIKGRFHMEETAREELAKLLHMEIRDAKRVLASIVTLMPERDGVQLIRALDGELNLNRRRILSLLAILAGEDDEAGVLNALFYWYLRRKEGSIPEPVRQRLLRLLRGVLDKSVREKLYTLFQYRDFTALGASRELRAYHTPERVAGELKQIAFGSAVFTLSWSRICALDMIVRKGLTECAPQIEKRLEDMDDIVRATAAWALFKLAPTLYGAHASRLKNDVSPLVSKTARQLGANVNPAVAPGRKTADAAYN